ncbi:putative gag-pol polyprotein, partial [Trifolium pratense]
MQDEFEMSMIGELKFFLGIQINQKKEGTYIHQTKYTKELLKKFHLDDCKTMNTLMHSTTNMSKIEDEGKVDQKVYRDPRESHLTAVKRIF